MLPCLVLDGLIITPEVAEDTGAVDTRDIIIHHAFHKSTPNIHHAYRNRVRSIPKVQSNNNGEGKSPNKLEVKRVDLVW